MIDENLKNCKYSKTRWMNKIKFWKAPYIFIVVLSTDGYKACLMVSGGLSQGFEIISNIDASKKWVLNTACLVAGQITVQPATLLIDKRAFVSSVKVQRVGTEDPGKYPDIGIWCTHVYVATLYYI